MLRGGLLQLLWMAHQERGGGVCIHAQASPLPEAPPWCPGRGALQPPKVRTATLATACTSAIVEPGLAAAGCGGETQCCLCPSGWGVRIGGHGEDARRYGGPAAMCANLCEG